MKYSAISMLLAFWANCLLLSAQTEVLVWSDEFNGTGAPDPKNWGYDLGNHGWGNNEMEDYTNFTTNARQENGNLVIQALKKDGKWTSARLISKGKAEFTYGRVVFRAKLPAGAGTWPALWMLGANVSSVGWPACGEIDVLEHVGRNPGVVQCALHTPSSSGNTVNKKEHKLPGFASGFHDYEVRWSPDKMDFLVDGKWYYTYNPAVKNAETWPFDKPQFLIMNIAMGGNFGSELKLETGGLKNGIDPALSAVTMEVDWVRVYQQGVSANMVVKQSGWPKGVKIVPGANAERGVLVLPEGKTAMLQMKNSQGKLVFERTLTQKETEIDFSGLTKGTYSTLIKMGKREYPGKITLK